MINMNFDPEVAPGYQDADIEMLEMAEAAHRAPQAPTCEWCYNPQTGIEEYWSGHRTVRLPHCERHKATAKAEAEHFGKE